jgi:rod shape-determining protein MreC
VIRLSIPARQILSKLTLPVLIAASFAILLVGKADSLLAERVRIALGDSLAPIYVALSEPLAQARAAVTEIVDLWNMRAENAQLRDENARLRQWQATALALDAENRRLKADLHWVPDPTVAFVTARAVADAGGVYARAVLLALGPNHFIHRGEIALDQDGLVGRVTEVGTRTARVLLITDLNSRVPVLLEPSGGHAIMTGTNGPRPRLLYWSDGAPPREGERVVTSPEAEAFPANLPVGTVRFSAANVPEVQPAAQLDRLEMVRIFDYGLNAMVPPETAHQPADRQPADRQPADHQPADRLR